MNVALDKLLLNAIACGALLGCSQPAPKPVETHEPAVATSASEPQPAPNEEERPVTPREKITLKLGEPVVLPGFDDTFELRSFVIESVEPDPTDPDDVGGAGIQLEISAASDSVTPYVNAAVDSPNPVVWTKDARIEVVGDDPNVPSVELRIDRITEEFEGDEVKLSLGIGESGDIGGAVMRFDGHSHKSVSAGQQSPLMMELTYDPEGRQLNDYVSLYPPDEATWRWRNYDFHLVGWEYDRRIELKVRRRQLSPVSKAQ